MVYSLTCPTLCRSLAIDAFLRAAFPRARVQNILDGLKEREAILLRTPNFVLLPDSKWDLTTVANLYLTAIAVDGASLRSLRDLRGKHLDLLRNIKAEVHRFVGERWGLESSQIRCFIHYQPSYCVASFSIAPL